MNLPLTLGFQDINKRSQDFKPFGKIRVRADAEGFFYDISTPVQVHMRGNRIGSLSKPVRLSREEIAEAGKFDGGERPPFFYGYSETQLSGGVSCASKIGSDSNQHKQTPSIRGKFSLGSATNIKSSPRECEGLVAGSGERKGILGLQLILKGVEFDRFRIKKKTPTYAKSR